MSRRFDLEAALDAYVAQARLTAGWLEDQDLSGPSSLPAWSRAELVSHICRSGRALLDIAGQRSSEPPLSIAAYVQGYAPAADEIAERSRRGTDADLSEVAAAVEQLRSRDHTVPAPRGPIRLSDFVATRVLEVLVHSLDLDRSVPLEPGALALVTRLLADVFADRHPGRAVELRVPPFAAVQAIDGTTHRRGTPPAVVETDPVSWVLLATGRIDWAEAAVVASGERSDLSALLPVLA